MIRGRCATECARLQLGRMSLYSIWGQAFCRQNAAAFKCNPAVASAPPPPPFSNTPNVPSVTRALTGLLSYSSSRSSSEPIVHSSILGRCCQKQWQCQQMRMQLECSRALRVASVNSMMRKHKQPLSRHCHHNGRHILKRRLRFRLIVL